MFVLSPVLSLVVVVFVPVFAFFAVRFRDRVFPASWNDQRLSGAVAGVVDEAVTGVRVVKAFAQEQREFDRLTEQAHELYQSRMRTARYNSRYASTLQALPMLAQLGVLALGGWLALEATSRSGCSSRSPATSCRSSRRCASSRACSPRRSRPAPAPSGSSSSSTCSRA
jgi:ATP-binding cassette subfamily B protein